MSFSKRMGLVPEKTIQLNDINYEIRVSVWNLFYLNFFSQFVKYLNLPISNSPPLYSFCRSLWMNFFFKRVDNINTDSFVAIDQIQSYLLECKWNKVYDFIEFVIKHFNDTEPQLNGNFIEQCNSMLNREGSGYRILNKRVAPISSEIEIKEIEEALSIEGLDNVSIHLNLALAKLSDKVEPDYRNSIKESISAIETLCREITGEMTLGKALKKFEESGIIFNNQFKDALEKLYAYSNNKETGIRHALLETPRPPEFEEAKFMLVVASAFINYLMTKKGLLKQGLTNSL